MAGESHRGVVAKVRDCELVVSEFKLQNNRGYVTWHEVKQVLFQSRYRFTFGQIFLGKVLTALTSSPSMGQIVPLLSFSNVGFSIK